MARRISDLRKLFDDPARFRLAGTFLAYSFTGEEAKVNERYAILDLLDAKRQKLAHVGDVVEG